MDQSLQEKLYTDFPKLFRTKDLPETKCLMCYGICCSDGWFELLYHMCREIDNICRDLEGDQYPAFFQIKQKFGELRVYFKYMTDDHDLSDKIYKIVLNYSIKSNRTCEICGEYGDLHVNKTGYIYVSCEKHIKD